MAEKTGELNKDSGVLSESDKKIISTTADKSDDAFVKKYSKDAADDPEEIRSDIEETRQEMSETIDAIQEKLSYENISEEVSEKVNEVVDSAKEAAFDATIGKAKNIMKSVGREMQNAGREFSKTEVGRSVISNPVPFALIGLGVGALLLNAFGKKKSSYNTNVSRRERSESDVHKPSMLRSAGERIGSTASSTYGSVSNAAQQAYQGVTGAAGTAYQSVDDAAHVVYDKAGEVSRQAKEQYEYYIEENPLAVGAVAFAVGAAVGYSLPATEYESRMMGETRDNLVTQAKSQMKNFVQTAKETAQETFQDELSGEGRRLSGSAKPKNIH